MTLDTAHSKEVYQGNGTATVFPFSFKVWDSSQVLVTCSLSEQVGETDVTAQSTITLTENGGTVTYLYAGAPLPSGATLAITRNMPFTQGVDLVSGSQFDPQVIEDALDQATAERQQVKEMLGRAVILPSTSDETPQEVVQDIYTARDEAANSAAAASASESSAATSATKSAAHSLLAEESRGHACQCADRAEQARDVAMQQAEAINVVMATEMSKINTIIATNKDDQTAAITASRAWSETDEDVPVDTDEQGNPEYSSKHWAIKSSQLLAGNASKTHKGVMQVGSGLDVADGLVSASVATTTSRGIGRVSTLADMGPDAVIENGPAFLAAGSEAVTITPAPYAVPQADASGRIHVGFIPGTFVGDMRLLPFRAADLATHCPGWHFCNGDQYSLISDVGIALNGLPESFKADWGIVVTGDHISIPKIFYSDGRGYFLRAVDGTTRQVGSVQQDAMQSHTHTYSYRASASVKVGGDQWHGIGDTTGTTSGASGRTDTETRVLNVGMTPAIFLDV